MQYVIQERNIAIIPKEQGVSPRVERHGNYIFAFAPRKGVKPIVVGMMLDAVLNNSEFTDDFKADAVRDLAKLKLFDAMVIKNGYFTVSNWVPDTDPNLDYYLRRSNLDKETIIDGEYHYVISERKSNFYSDELKKLVGDKRNLFEILPALESTGLIGKPTVIELPWVNDFEFTQPKGSIKPEDFRR